MEEILEIIKSTKEFQQYAQIVEKYDDLPTINNYKLQERYAKDPSGAMLESAKIEKREEQIHIELDNLIGKLDKAEIIGNAIYSVDIEKQNNDLVLRGNIAAGFYSYNDSMFNEIGTRKGIFKPLIDDNFENRFENMAHVYPTMVK